MQSLLTIGLSSFRPSEKPSEAILPSYRANSLRIQAKKILEKIGNH